MSQATSSASKYDAIRGERHYNWKGGRVVSHDGYVKIKVGPAHHLADPNGYALEHRIIAEQKLGRRLQPGEIVHHLDENKQNNHPDNLEVLPSAAHHAHEHGARTDRRGPDEPNPEIVCTCGCQQILLKYDTWGRPRERIPEHVGPWIAPERVAAARAERLAGASWRQLEARSGIPLRRLRRLCADVPSNNTFPRGRR